MPRLRAQADTVKGPSQHHRAGPNQLAYGRLRAAAHNSSADVGSSDRGRRNIAANRRLAKPAVFLTIGTSPASHSEAGPSPLQGATLTENQRTSANETDLARIPQSSRRSAESVLMDTSEVAAMLNMSTSWMYKEAAKLGLRGYKLGRGRNAKVLYKRSEIFRWLEQQRIH